MQNWTNCPSLCHIKALPLQHEKRPMALSRLGMLLGQQGFKKTRVGKQRICGWIVHSFKSDEIESRKRLHAREIDV